MKKHHNEITVNSKKTIRSVDDTKSFSSFLKQMRIDAVEDLKNKNEYKVYEIAEKLGVNRKRLEQIIYKITPTKSRDLIIAI